MKFTLSGLLTLRPFSEGEGPCPGETYSKSPILTVAIIVNAVLGIIAVILAMAGNVDKWFKVASVSIAISTLIAGFEWHLGLKARSLNQIFASFVLIGMAYLLL